MNALIVFASFTGNTEALAQKIQEGLSNKGFKVDCRICTDAIASDFLNYDICLLGTYTWGSEAELPDEMYGFYDDLKTLDLRGKFFAVFGTGDIYYDYFCKSVDDFEAQFLLTRAQKIATSLKIDAAPKDMDQSLIDDFVSQITNYF